MMTETAPAGWYPNPNGEPGQIFWDGQQWLTDPRVTAPPTAPVKAARPQWDRAQQFWSRLTRERQIALAAAGLLAVVTAVAVPIVALSVLLGNSASYDAGYASGSTGAAHGAAPMLGADLSCHASYSKAQMANSALDGEDYVQGCLDGLHDHAPGS